MAKQRKGPVAHAPAGQELQLTKEIMEAVLGESPLKDPIVKGIMLSVDQQTTTPEDGAKLWWMHRTAALTAADGMFAAQDE